jgi:hypothetical protein
LIAVSKTVEAERIRAAVGAGVAALGENRVQEAKEKVALLGRPVPWHLIGSLQTNKAKDAVQLFDWIHFGSTMNGSRAAISRTICHDALPFPMIIDARSSSAGTPPPRKISPTSSRLARCSDGWPRGATPPRYTTRSHPLPSAARTKFSAQRRSTSR